MASKQAANSSSLEPSLPVVPVLAAWLIPGGGHLWQRHWGRGGLLLFSVGSMFALGLAMRGRFFELTPATNLVETLGFLGDLGTGLLFLGARFFGYDQDVMASPMADYGTKFLLVAGLLNILCILDAYDIATGKKS